MTVDTNLLDFSFKRCPCRLSFVPIDSGFENGHNMNLGGLKKIA